MMSKAKINKLFKKQQIKKASSKRKGVKPPPKEESQHQSRVTIENLKESISRKLNNKEMAKRAALIIEEMIKSKKGK